MDIIWMGNSSIIAPWKRRRGMIEKAGSVGLGTNGTLGKEDLGVIDSTEIEGACEIDIFRNENVDASEKTREYLIQKIKRGEYIS
jgi:hypothetical protein